MRLCMFTPRDQDLERGWPGRLEDDQVVQLAAQTLQAFFTGGGDAREHAVYPLADVVLRAPVLHPPSVRIFDDDGDFAFANPASIFGPDAEVPCPAGASELYAEQRPAAVLGLDGAIGGYTIVNALVAPELAGAKSRDFAISLGPVVVTPDEFAAGEEWAARVAHAGRDTRLLPGDVIAAPSVRVAGPFAPGDVVELELEGIGVLRNSVARR